MSEVNDEDDDEDGSGEVRLNVESYFASVINYFLNLSEFKFVYNCAGGR